MRALRIASGIAVLFVTLAYAHLLHHHFMGASSHSDPVFLILFLLAFCAGILSVIGAYFLFKGPR